MCEAASANPENITRGGRAAVDERTWNEFRERFEANGKSAPLSYAPVPRVGPLGRSLLEPPPLARDSCALAGIPAAVCRLEPRARRRVREDSA